MNKKCIPCEGGDLPPLSRKTIGAYLKTTSEWQIDAEYKKISREYVFKDFTQSMAFVNQVAKLSEQEGHHPDIAIFYNRVLLRLTTHAILRLSQNDFILAKKINIIGQQFIFPHHT